MAKQNSSKSKKRVFLFGKRSIEALPDPEPGERYPCQDTRNPYLFLRVSRNKKDTHTTKSFYWQRKIKGEQKTVHIDTFSAINPDIARDKAEEIAARYTMGEDVQEEAREARSELTLGELWGDYRLNRKRGRLPNGEIQISEANEYNWERHFKKWEKKKLSDISFNRARKMILDIRKTAPVHGNRVHRLGRGMWNHAINELRWKGENPFTFSEASEKGRSRKNIRLHSTDMPAFMAALDTLTDTMRVLFLSSLFTGRRIGEIKSMRWVDVDLESGKWFIPDTKSGEPQSCILPKPLIELLQDRKPEIKSKWVFPAHSKSGHVEAINTAWEQVRSYGMTKKEYAELKSLHKKVVSGEATPKQVDREIELQNKSKFLHLQARDLRGTLASWLQEAGVPLVGAQQQLGHADAATTADSYTSISESLQRIGVDAAAKAMVEAAK